MTNQALARPRTQAQRIRASRVSRVEMIYCFIAKDLGDSRRHLYAYRDEKWANSDRDMFHDSPMVVVLSKVKAYAPVEFAMLDEDLIIHDY